MIGARILRQTLLACVQCSLPNELTPLLGDLQAPVTSHSNMGRGPPRFTIAIVLRSGSNKITAPVALMTEDT
jgi:hypothetical protein